MSSPSAIPPLLHNSTDISYNPLAADVSSPATSQTRDPSSQINLSWTDLTFSVPLTGAGLSAARAADPAADARKDILHGISGSVAAGEMLCILGPSGSGKTSLVQLLAGRAGATKGSHVGGRVDVNGAPRDFSTFSKNAAYVQQDDDMFGELTVGEHIGYAAQLRLPSSMTKERKALRCEKVVQELGLGKCVDTQIGNETIRGVSGGERKRVSIATELVADSNLLIADECTSGLDAKNAYTVIATLRRLASNGRTIISTIHQPRSSIFALFDRLLVLSEGRTMYFGPAADAVTYFSALDFHAPPTFNPADFFLDLVSVDPRSVTYEENTKARIQYLGEKQVEKGVGVDDVDHPPPETAASLAQSAGVTSYQRGWLAEFRILLGRAVKIALRAKMANVVRLFQTVFFGVLISLLWIGNGRGDTLNERASLSGLLFFISINQAFVGVFATIFDYPLERSVVTRERSSSTYRTSTYYVAKMLTELPRTMVYVSVFMLVTYFTIGLKLTLGAFLRFYLVVLLISNFGEALAVAISILTGDAQTSASIAPVLIIIWVLFSGFFTTTDQIPAFVSWIKWISFVYYSANAMAKVEFPDRPFGDEVLKLGGYNDLSYWENVGGLVGLLILLKIIGYLALKFLRAPKFLKF